MIRYQNNNELTRDQWLMARNNTIGASEVGIIVVGSNFSSSLELYYNKIGLGRPTIQNIRMSIGTNTEPIIRQYWKYYEGSEESIVLNEQRGRIVKDCRNDNQTIFNDKYPHLSATPDGIILPYGVYAGKGEGSLELKNTMGFVLKAYEGGIPTVNLFQNVTQIMLGEFGYGEIFYFIDNSRFQLETLLRKDTRKVEEAILIHTTDFWNRVTKARKVVGEMFEFKRTHNYRAADKALLEIQALEPPVQNTNGYLNFLTEKYKDRIAGVGLKQGSQTDLQIAKKHRELSKKIDKLEKDQRLLEIQLKLIMKESTVLDFGKEGKITYHPNSNNNRIFKNSIK